MNIFLVGPMGAGKSTIGKRLAKQLNMAFSDSDSEIEARTGVDIATIFDIEGEEGFRKRERQMIDELTAKKNTVLATGGGAILAKENQRCLTSRGHVVYLRTSVAQQLARTSHDKSRPLLASGDPEARLKEIMRQREPIYDEIADMVVDTDHRHVNQVVKDIQKSLRNL